MTIIQDQMRLISFETKDESSPTKKEPKGSQKWLQRIVNIYPERLNARIVEKIPSLSDREIFWLSPLEKDEFAEYRDAAFLQRLGLPDLTEELTHFWPEKWTAMGCSWKNVR